MIESILKRKNASLRTKITVKLIISVALVALAVVLPQIVHAAMGASGGMKWLPMYLPVLIGGCLLGWKWGICVGVASPVVSFAITSIVSSPMPAAIRLPYMIAELAVFAAVSGIFSARIAKNAFMAFPAVIAAEIAGRAVFFGLVVLFENVSSLSAAVVWSQIQAGLVGLVAQAVLAPIVVLALKELLDGTDGRRS